MLHFTDTNPSFRPKTFHGKKTLIQNKSTLQTRLIWHGTMTTLNALSVFAFMYCGYPVAVADALWPCRLATTYHFLLCKNVCCGRHLLQKPVKMTPVILVFVPCEGSWCVPGVLDLSIANAWIWFKLVVIMMLPLDLYLPLSHQTILKWATNCHFRWPKTNQD